MTTKVTVYLNEAAVSFFAFKPFNPEKAALRKAITFEMDRDIRFASKNGTKAAKEDITRALDIVYVRLDVGGDIYPHTSPLRPAHGRSSTGTGAPERGAMCFAPAKSQSVVPSGCAGHFRPGTCTNPTPTTRSNT